MAAGSRATGVLHVVDEDPVVRDGPGRKLVSPVVTARDAC